MLISGETQEKIKKFAETQSRFYTDWAEMTYLEKLRKKAGDTKRKAGAKLSRFKSRSAQTVDAQNDMVLYMNDYINDLMENGMAEGEALAKAESELSVPGGADAHDDFRKRYLKYYEERDIAEYEVIGLFYGGFCVIGVVVGAIIGYAQGGGRMEFLTGGWIDTVIGAVVGSVLGAGLGQIANGIIVSVKKK